MAMQKPDGWNCLAGECRIQAWPSLHEMSQVIAQSADLNETVQIMLHIMEKHMRVVRGTISLCDRHTGVTYIHQSIGLTEEEEARGVYQFGEGITGRVVETGQAIVLQRIGEDSAFLNLTRTHTEEDNDLSFICVPIKRGDMVMGIIGVERLYDNETLLNLDTELIGIAASMMAPAVELYLLETADQAALRSENQRLHEALKDRYCLSNIIGNCKAMQKVYKLIAKVAKTKTTVLILGESGVGKELIASAIHYSSSVSKGPFVQFNCAALPESLIESELFGHEKGAFTGAIGARKGRFEDADRGTIFLDEVGDLPLSAQAKLLRVLQERTLERVGSNKSIQVDIRIVAATNRNLEEMVARREFREDLYYRLNVFPIAVPPLRERGADIIALADHFTQRYAQKNGKDITRISTPALNMLMSYHWPGNVRELENVIERSTILAEDGVIHGYDLPPSLQMPAPSDVIPQGSFQSRIAAYGYEMIVDALKASNGNTSEAATMLGLTRRTMSLRMKEYGISYKSYRSDS